MAESCMHDRFVQCFRDCKNCPRNAEEPDWDDLYELAKDDEPRTNKPERSGWDF